MRQAPVLLGSFGTMVALISALGAVPPPAGGLPEQAAKGGTHTGAWTREPDKDGWRVAFQFTNYNGDRLAAAFPVSRLDITQATDEFGYSKADTDAILESCRGTCDQAEYDRRILDYYHRRGVA